MKAPDIDTVTGMILEVAAEVVGPRFRALRRDEIHRKHSRGDPLDVVTVADQLVEDRLGHALRSLSGGVPVLGEEAAFLSPSLLDLVKTDGPLWILDPIDGTRNFVRGDDAFGIMVAWVVAGQARAGWIVLPARGRAFSAEEGSGARSDGRRLRVSYPGGGGRPRGTLNQRYMSPGLAAATAEGLGERYLPDPGSGCAAVDYTDVLEGRKDFAVYHRLHPWDHAPGALILTEGGGRVEHMDGLPYTPRSRDQLTVVSAHPALAAEVRGWLGGAGGARERADAGGSSKASGPAPRDSKSPPRGDR